MANSLIDKPETGQNINIDLTDDSNLNFSFSMDDIEFERIENDLIFKFDDNSAVNVNDFYVAFSDSDLPMFSFGNQIVSGEAFLAMPNDDLMPAAGNAGAEPTFREAETTTVIDGNSAMRNRETQEESISFNVQIKQSSKKDSESEDSTQENTELLNNQQQLQNREDSSLGAKVVSSGNDAYISPDKQDASEEKVEIEITLGENVQVGDEIKVTDPDSNEYYKETVTEEMLEEGSVTVVIVQASVSATIIVTIISAGEVSSQTVTIRDIINANSSIVEEDIVATPENNLIPDSDDSGSIGDAGDGDNSGNGGTPATLNIKFNQDLNNDNVISDSELGTSQNINVTIELKDAKLGDTLIIEYGTTTQQINVTNDILINGYTFESPALEGGEQFDVKATIIDSDNNEVLVSSSASFLTQIPVLDLKNISIVEGTSSVEQNLDFDFNGESGTITIGDGPNAINIAISANGLASFIPGSANSIVGANGVLYVTIVNGSIKYIYDANISDHSAGVVGDDFKIVATDFTGESVESSISTTVTDTVFIANDDFASLEERASMSANVFDNDSVSSDTYELTSITAPDASWIALSGTELDGYAFGFKSDFGILLFDTAGNYTFISTDKNLTQDQESNFTFTYTVTESDGSESSADLTITVIGTNDLPIIDASGSFLTTFDSVVDAVGSSTSTGSFTIDSVDGIKSLTIKDANGNAVKLFDDYGNIKSGLMIVGVAGILSGFVYEQATGKISYIYTQTENALHNSLNESGEKFEVEVTDNDGDIASGTINVNIIDDTPATVRDIVATASSDTVTTIVNIDVGADDEAGKTLEFGGKIFTYGADGKWTSNDGTGVYYDTSGTAVLEANGTTLKNDGTSDLWTVTITNVPANGALSQTITVRDADGDGSSFDITAKNSIESTGTITTSDEFAGLLTPGTNYNISIIFDTSGSMYHDSYNDIQGPETRLEFACDAVIDYVKNTLYPHAASELGGVINLHLVTFWGKSAGGYDGYRVMVDGSLSLEQNLEDIIAQIEEIKDEKNSIPKNEFTDTGFHWHTYYEKGFDASADWFNSTDISGNGYENKVFFITDGEPTIALGHTFFERTLSYNALIDAIGPDGDVHAIGLSSHVSKNTLDKYDTNNNATMVRDDEIHNMFLLEGSDANIVKASANIVLGSDGNDALFGATEIETLRLALKAELGQNTEISDANLLEFMQHNPKWLVENIKNETNDPDILLAGTGDDILYGEGGDDVLIGDGNSLTLEQFAENIGLSTDVAKTYGFEEIYSDSSNPQQLVIDLSTKAQTVDASLLTGAAMGLENSADGDDIIYAGSGDDVLLGLGGNDVLYGDGGDDIIFGGSGDDTISGGLGNDILSGGDGADVFTWSSNDFDGGIDRVIDFDLTQGDKIELDGFSLKDLNISAKAGEINIYTSDTHTLLHTIQIDNLEQSDAEKLALDLKNSLI